MLYTSYASEWRLRLRSASCTPSPCSPVVMRGRTLRRCVAAAFCGIERFRAVIMYRRRTAGARIVRLHVVCALWARLVAISSWQRVQSRVCRSHNGAAMPHAVRRRLSSRRCHDALCIRRLWTVLACTSRIHANSTRAFQDRLLARSVTTALLCLQVTTRSH